MKRTLILAAGGLAAAMMAHAEGNKDFSAVDTNSDGSVSQSEFVTWKTNKGDKTQAEAMEAFAEVDTDADGLISADEYKAAMADWKARKDGHDEMDETTY